MSRLEIKIEALSDEVATIDTHLNVIQKAIEEVETELKKHLLSTNNFDTTAEDKEVEKTLSSIRELEGRVDVIRSSNVSQQDSYRKIENEIAVLEYKLSEIVKERDGSGEAEKSNKDLYKVDLLKDAVKHLEDLRVVSNKSIIDEFKEIILATLHSLGLDSFSDIEIDSRLRITYVQEGQCLSYSDITEGEQLRVKIALYLSLVQLNSEYGVGNHPRFLIIDSPGKEEADDKYFDGFIEALNVIENKFSEKIQILIGSADRRLCDIISNDKQEIKGKGEAFF